MECSAIEWKDPFDRWWLMKADHKRHGQLPFGRRVHVLGFICRPSNKAVAELIPLEYVAWQRKELSLLNDIKDAVRGGTVNPRWAFGGWYVYPT